ncbi:MAG: patatin-like phospholipase family protein [Bacteroidales bacterium]|nr:patatin-like phospholipase family protein [Bacteroidales bacterium]
MKQAQTPKMIAEDNKPTQYAKSAEGNSASVAENQTPPTNPAERPRVAVVLSGGGAKGVAHISALRVVEEAGIPIDIVCGTSMGSLIGGLYAIGYTCDELDSLVRSQDWTVLLTDRDDPSLQPLGERRRGNTYAISRNIYTEPSNTAVGGLVRGKNLAALFNSLCDGYLDSMDFATLPIAYACAATNIVDNTEVDFFAGRLPQAMRASMAIPAAFTPVRVDDKVLVDGGLRNNYPADLARQLGADVVIGVTVQSDLLSADELDNAVSIFGQIIDVNCKNKYDANLANSDVVIKVNVDGYSAASFVPAAIDTLLRRGDEAARAHWGDLIALRKRYGIDSTARSDAPIGRAPRPHPTPIETQKGPTHAHSAAIHIGLRFDTEETVAMQLGADLPLRGALPFEANATLRLGRRIMGRLEGRLLPNYTAPSTVAYTFNHDDIDINRQGRRAYNVKYNHHRFDLVPLSLSTATFNFYIGARWDYYNYYGKILSASAETFDINNNSFFSYRAGLTLNTENRWYFPTRGSAVDAGYAMLTTNLIGYNGGAPLHDAHVRLRTNIALTRRLTLQPMFYSRLFFGHQVPLPLSNALGAEWFGQYVDQQVPFAGVGNVELVERHLTALQLQATLQIGRHHHVQLRIAAAKTADAVGALAVSPLMVGAAAAYNYSTMFGPLGLSAGYSNHTRKPYIYLNLGHQF